MDDFHKVRALRHLGKNKSEIGRELGLDRKTVRKYLQSQSPPRYISRKSPSKADPFRAFEDYVRSKLELAPQLSGDEIFALIRPQGYQGSVRTIERRLKSWREQKNKERFFEQEYEPGEQSQFDFKESVELPFVDGARLVHLHFGTLPFSDVFFIKGFPAKTYECFIDGVHSFFENIGGQTKNIRFDNLSSCVKRVYNNGNRDYTPAFERAIKYYNVGTLPCTPGKGSDKGDVERDIRTWSRRITNHIKVHGLALRDFDHLNEILAELCKRECEGKERFALEQSRLLPLLPREEDVLCRIEQTRASPYGTVRINKTAYSVPDQWIGEMCRAVMGPFEVRITRLSRPTEFALHPRKPEGEHSIMLEHVITSLLRKPQAMVRWAHREILFPDPAFRELYRRLQTAADKMPGFAEREFLRVINLVHFVSLSEIKIAVDLVLGSKSETKPESIFFEIKDLLLHERRPQASVIDLHPFQVPLTPNLSTYDRLMPTAVNP